MEITDVVVVTAVVAVEVIAAAAVVVEVTVVVVAAAVVVNTNRSKAVEVEGVGPRLVAEGVGPPRWVHSTSNQFSLHSNGVTSQGHLVRVRVSIRLVGLRIISRVSSSQLDKIRVVVALGPAVAAAVLLGPGHNRSSHSNLVVAAVVLLGPGHRRSNMLVAAVVLLGSGHRRSSHHNMVPETSSSGMCNPVAQKHQMFARGVHLQTLVLLLLSLLILFKLI